MLDNDSQPPASPVSVEEARDTLLHEMAADVDPAVEPLVDAFEAAIRREAQEEIAALRGALETIAGMGGGYGREAHRRVARQALARLAARTSGGGG